MSGLTGRKVKRKMSGSLTSCFAQTACLRCREQKLRCSRQLPQCARCTKLKVACTFPEPPDRRLIAIRRESRRRQLAWDESFDENTRPAKRPRVAYSIHSPPLQTSSGEEQDVAPPDMMSLDVDTHIALQDTYFSSLTNTSLTFHRPTFERDYARGDVPEHVLQAMYAVAVCLLPLSSSDPKRDVKLRDLGLLKSHNIAWAIQAGKTALQHIDQPTFPAIQTCLILALFWFSRGDSRRNTMFSGIAHKAARCMLQDCAADTAIDKEDWHPRWLEFEQLRRCFWASWHMYCINSDQYAAGSPTGRQIMALPLPVSEHAFLHSKSESFSTLGGKTDLSLQETPSIMAELMKLILLWARVRDHIDARRFQPEKEPWNNVYILYDELTDWKRQLHHSLSYSKRNLYELLVIQQQNVYVLLYAQYHQCCLVLQASLIPSLSGSLSQDKTPPEAARTSAKIAISHAQALSELASDLIALDWEPTRIPPFVGYSMYVSATVHLIAMARDAAMIRSGEKHLVACLHLLKSMRPYWAIVGQLWDRFQRLYEMQMSVANQPLPLPSSNAALTLQSNGPDGLADGDDIARNVNEVLNDSMLYFSLRELQKTDPRPRNDEPVPGTSVLDKVISQSSREKLSNVLELDNSAVFSEDDQESYSTDIVTLQTDSKSQGTALAPATSAENDISDFSASNLQSRDNIEHWWEWDVGADFQEQFPFDDFFAMDFAFQ